MTTTMKPIAAVNDRGTPEAVFARLSEASWTLTPMPGEALIRINLLNATVSRGSGIGRLRGRDLQLAYCIALHERPVSRLALSADVWPNADDDDARNRFDVALHRLRKQLGRRDAISLTPQGYALGPHVTTDLRALETFRKTLAGRTAITDYEIELMRAAHRRLGMTSAPTQIAATETGEIFERRVEYLKHEFARQLGSVSLLSNHARRALDIARDMIRLDGCDESAWEIAIRAHLAQNDRSAAIHDYRTYARNLDRELGLPPSRVIRQLITQHGSDPNSMNGRSENPLLTHR